jgi:hypothetical protein
MSRPDTLILTLEAVKEALIVQIIHCEEQLAQLNSFVNDPNYAEYATQLEKNNCTTTLIPLITQGMAVLKAVVWEEE